MPPSAGRSLRVWAVCAALILLSPLAQAGTKLLRFPDIRHDRIVFSYAGDLWTVGTQGGTAIRLTAHPGLELFAKFSPDGRHIAFTGQYGGDEQVYVMPAEGGAPVQLTFYPASGPLADRWGYDNQVYGWKPDGSAVLFRSSRDSARSTDARLYTVPIGGGAATALPMPTSGAGQFSPDGRRLVYSPLWRDFRNEKRYQGGWANDLYVFDLDRPSLQRITQDPHTDRDPMWVGGAIYFNSDRDGIFNLYRYDLASRVTRQITHHRDWDVRWPSADAEGQIVYELAGELHVLDTQRGGDRAVSVDVPVDSTVRRPHVVNAADNIEGFALSPGGDRAAVAARGDVFTVAVEHGASRNLTHSSDAHDREPAWSADGTRIAYVSDRSGEEELYVQLQDGTAPARRLTEASRGRYFAPRWSPDGARIAISDQTGRLHVVVVATGVRTEIAKDPGEPALDYCWSPDGRSLAYSLAGVDGLAGVYVWSVDDRVSHRMTPEGFNAQSPAWAPDGDFLYFLSARQYLPLISSVEFDFATDRPLGIFAVALHAGLADPFSVHDAGPRPAGREGAPAHSSRIDYRGIAQRVIRVPLEADNLSALHAGEDVLVYQQNGPGYYGRDAAGRSKVMAYSLKSHEAKTVAEDVADWSVSRDGRHVLAQVASKELKYFDVGKGEGPKVDEGKTVSLTALQTTSVPAAEWRQIFDEVWRRYRDYFYVANMHGYDWAAMRLKYAPLLEHVNHRVDLNHVIAEMISELVVQHAYVEGGDLGLPKRPFVALPGARLQLDPAAGRYRITKIFVGQNEEEAYRSPLTEVGVDARVGDYVLAINGRELTASLDPYELLEGPPNQPVEWRVSAHADGSAARTIRFEPLASETALIYLEWVEANRARVATMSAGRLGYVHIPDMGEAGLREFIKWWYPQIRKEGLLVDVRHNGGGNVSEMILERLARTLHGTRFGRNHETPATYPHRVQAGPKAAIIDETTSSDGDIFANAFREWRLGTLVGKRTWGGAVGIADRGPLLDGGMIFVPEFGTADAAGHWIIEGYGVDPDIEVDQDPLAVTRGHDPQLERAVVELMKALPRMPAGLPARPPAPVKTEVR